MWRGPPAPSASRGSGSSDRPRRVNHASRKESGDDAQNRIRESLMKKAKKVKKAKKAKRATRAQKVAGDRFFGPTRGRGCGDPVAPPKTKPRGADPYAHTVPTLSGGVGRPGVFVFYPPRFAGKMPADTRIERI